MKNLKSAMVMVAMVTAGLLMTTVSAKAASSEEFGVGIILGDPTGLSVKMKADGGHSIDGALAYSSGRRNGLQLHGDYLWDRARSWGTNEGPLDMYYGLGARLITYNDDRDKGLVSFGPRGSIGLSFNINNPNLELFGELAAVLELAPSVGADIDAGIGCRIRF